MHQNCCLFPSIFQTHAVYFRLSTMAIIFNATFLLTLHNILFNKNLVNQRVIAIIWHTRTKFIIYNKMHFKVRAKANADNNYLLLLLISQKKGGRKKMFDIYAENHYTYAINGKILNCKNQFIGSFYELLR